MRSSTSSSDGRPDLRRAIVWLLAGCVVVCAGVEAAARVGFNRVSRIQRRFLDEYRAAEQMRPGRGDSRTLLVVGNSLLVEGVQFDQLHDALAADHWKARRLALERTFYNDWYYGLRELLQRGAHPDAVVLMLGPRQWILPDIRGEFSAHYLLNGSDVLRLARETRMRPTETTNLLAANASAFWAVRAEMRNFLLSFLVPDMSRLVGRFTAGGSTPLSPEEVAIAARQRIARLHALTDAYGIRLALLLPPALVRGQEGDAWIGLKRAADANDVSFVKPFDGSTFDAGMFRDDGFHLNAKGAMRYTTLLAPALRQTLDELVNAPRSAKRSDGLVLQDGGGVVDGRGEPKLAIELRQP
jgi:lysophospholipase L1-like esterase